MKIGIYGGTFNPPHRGHLTAAAAVVSMLKLDKLQQFPVALGAQPHQLLLLRQCKGPALASSLKLNDLAQLVHHAVQIHLCAAVLAVLKVQHRLLVHDSSGNAWPEPAR